MSKGKSYLEEGQKAIQQHRHNAANRPRKEWTNYNDYIRDQKIIHDEFFSKPAKICGLCGYAMDYKGHKLSEWEERWSIHEVCKKKMDNLLDRESGAARDRRALERRRQLRR